MSRCLSIEKLCMKACVLWEGYSRRCILPGCSRFERNEAEWISQSDWSCCCRLFWHFQMLPWWGCKKRWICMCTWKCLGCVCVFRNVFYLLCTMACSTRVLFSVGGVPAVFWLMTDRNCSSSLVLSVFPAPLSPLVNTHAHIHLWPSLTFVLPWLNLQCCEIW